MKDTLVNNFIRISNIPRTSGNEEKIAAFFMDVARKNNFYCYKDEYNNVLIKKKGVRDVPPIALQAHLDMVGVKEYNSCHDFLSDGIEVIVDDDKVFANGTSLGADQGVGLAMMLTLMEDKSGNHPDLEFMFTTEEETTFNGAVNFPYSKVDSKRLINLDNSKDDTVFIGADGDIFNEYTFKGDLIETDLPSYRVLLSGYEGGNSGDEVVLSENNPITTMALQLKNKDVLIKSINGGSSENDLATSCEVVINTSLDVNTLFENLNVDISLCDNHLAFSKSDTENILNEILDLKCGFITEYFASANLGLIKTSDNILTIYYVFRSMDYDELDNINAYTRNLNNGFLVREVYTDSVWQVDYESTLLEQYKNLYFKEYNAYPKEGVFHGGIECATIKNRIDGLDIISIGANILKYHTTEETTYISSWLKVYSLLLKFLEIVE